MKKNLFLGLAIASLSSFVVATPFPVGSASCTIETDLVSITCVVNVLSGYEGSGTSHTAFLSANILKDTTAKNVYYGGLILTSKQVASWSLQYNQNNQFPNKWVMTLSDAKNNHDYITFADNSALSKGSLYNGLITMK